MRICTGELDPKKTDFAKRQYAYKTPPCPNLLTTGDTAITKNGKKLQPHCFYCTDVVSGARKIGDKASFTVRTPKWCPKNK